MLRSAIAALFSIAFLWALALSVAPHLHEHIHSDANRVEHSCAVTFVNSGGYDHVDHPPATALPDEPAQFSQLPAFSSRWVQSAFLGASIFEHAPPARV